MEIQELKDHFDTKFDSLNMEIQGNNTVIKTMQNDVGTLKSDVGTLKEAVLQNCSKLDTLESKIDQLLSK